MFATVVGAVVNKNQFVIAERLPENFREQEAQIRDVIADVGDDGQERVAVDGDVLIIDGNARPARRDAVIPKTTARPRQRRENFFIGILIEPRRPPAERAVGYDRVLAKAKQIKFFVIRFAIRHELRRHIKLEIFANPLQVVGKDERRKIRESLFQLLDASLVVIQRNQTNDVNAANVIAVTNVQGNGAFGG